MAAEKFPESSFDGLFRLPPKWEWVKLSDCAKITRGRGKRDDRLPTEMRFCGFGLPQGMTPEQLASSMKITYEKAPTAPGRCCPVIAVKGVNSGNIVLWADWDKELPDTFAALEPTPDLDGRYLFYLMQSAIVREQLSSRQTTVGRVISERMLSEVFIPVAPLPLQRGIVKTLDSIFGKIVAAEDNAKRASLGISEHMMQGLDSLFSAEKGYKMVRLDEVCSLKTGMTRRTVPYGEIPVITPRFINGDADKLSECSCAESPDERYMVEEGDLLMCRVTGYDDIGNTAVFRGGSNTAMFNSSIIRIRPDFERISGDYLGYVMDSPTAREYLRESSVRRQAYYMLNHKAIGGFMIPLPSQEEQRALVSALDSISQKKRRITAIAEELTGKCAEVRASLLDSIFRGECSIEADMTVSEPVISESITENIPENIPKDRDEKKPAPTQSEPKKAQSRTVVRIPKEIAERLRSKTERKLVKAILSCDGGAAYESELLGVQSDKLGVLNALGELTERGILTKKDDLYRLGE